MSSPPSSPSLLDKLLFVLAPLRAAAESETYLRQATRGLGWDLEAAGVDLPGAVASLRELASDIDALMRFGAEPPTELDGYLKLLAASGRVFDRLRDVGRLFDAAGGGDLGELGRDLMDGMALAAWYRFAPISFAVANVLTLLDQAPEANEISNAGAVIRHKRPKARIRFDRIGPLLRDPVGLMREEYFSVGALTEREAAFRAADRLFPRLAFLARQLGLGARYGLPPEVSVQGDAGTREDLDHTLTIFGAPGEGPAFGASFALSSAPKARGLIMRPFGQIAFQRDLGPWRFSLESSETVGGALFGERVELSGGGALRLRCRAELADGENRPTTLGGTSGSGLQLGAARVEGAFTIVGEEVDAALDLSFDHVRLRLSSADGDEFLSNALPKDGLNADMTLAIGWSNRNGFHLSGSAGLEATLPLSARIGPVTLDSLNLGIATDGGAIRAQASLGAGLNLGPFAVRIDRVGLEARVDFPEGGGNLGIANLDFRFKPPNGLGVVINAPTVIGGGYLRFDPPKEEYSGVLEIQVAETITLKAIGLLITRMPDGAKGYSLLIIITAEDFKPIPLPLGFRLMSIGGLLAINRTCNEDALRQGIKNQTLSNILFPKDPIRNAAQIFSSLNAVFPPKSGSYLFGPVVKICWGTPPVLTMDLGLVLELGNRTRLIILGRISAILPSEKLDLIRLQMNTVGVIDFDQKSASIDAVLYDSRLVGKFPLTGAMAMRLTWGASPTFALSIGGFHPAFKPPANFPALERIAISLSESENFRLRCEAYLAITSNTLQFGARAELYARAGGFSVEGKIGFDVLIQFDPFSFVADFHASAQLKHGSTNLFMVKVEGQLSGPRPLHVKGKATFEIFWCDFSVGFDRTLISGEPPPAAAPVVVMEKLKAALNDPRNWGGQLADGDRRMVSLRDGHGADVIALHPLGRLSVKQTVVPLELEISKFGQTRPADARLFKINSVSVNGKAVGFDREKDFFPPAAFLNLTDDEKLAAPSFELMTAGVSLNAGGFLVTSIDADMIEDEKIRYETIIIDKEDPQPRPPLPPIEMNPANLDKQILFGAAARSEVRRTGMAKYRPAGRKNTSVKDGWTIVSTADQSRQAAPGVEAGAKVTYAEAFQALQTVKQEDPGRGKSLMILRASEVIADK